MYFFIFCRVYLKIRSQISGSFNCAHELVKRLQTEVKFRNNYEIVLTSRKIMVSA